MNPWEIRVGDVLDKLREMPDESVHCVVTSPPYWGLRDYGVEGQMGLESSPDDYVSKMVVTFREIRRVLRSDGTLWLNLGDSYAGSWGAQSRGNTTGEAKSRLEGSSMLSARQIKSHPLGTKGTGSLKRTPGLKNKDLVGIPWKVAFALQADGWYLRSDIVWAKSNPMPESVTDRLTKAHEYLFLLTKSERYYYDIDAIKEAAQSDHASGNGFKREQRLSYRDENGARGNDHQWTDVGGKRNRRTVWNVSTQPFKGAHFATFPPKLIEPCILAGTSALGCCISCGSPWKQERVRTSARRTDFRGSRFDIGKTAARTGGDRTQAGDRFVSVSGNWTPTCDCVPNTPIPATVLDPFSGAATTLLVATQHGRNSIGIELNPEYAAMAERRLLAPPKVKKASRKKLTVSASNPLLPLETLSVTSLFLQ